LVVLDRVSPDDEALTWDQRQLRIVRNHDLFYRMDGPHDLGGKTGFGEVTREVNEPAFHEPWEGLAWALNILAIGKLRAYKVDTYRHAVERMKPSWYGDARYYERMLAGVTTLLVEEGVVLLRTLSAVLAVACRCPIPWHDCQSCKPSILKHQRPASHRVTLCG